MTGFAAPAYPYWAASSLDKLPARWRERMAGKWRDHAQALADKGRNHAAADAWLRRRLAELQSAYRAGLSPAMDDAAICKAAEAEATDYGRHFADLDAKARMRWAQQGAERQARGAMCLKTWRALWLMRERGMADMWPEGAGMTPAGKLARLEAPEFWRRAFRKAHVRTIEQCAIAIGFVRADADCYVSRDSLRIVQQRQVANAAMLKNTVAVNEYGDERTLAALAERSVANPTIRRGELMTRVAGFEGCADALGHVKRWAVLTCPSRMHKFTLLDNGKVIENKRYDGTHPREAQAYLARQWRRLQAWWERQGLRMYGFRTTEPHHEGCPHWNVLAFFEPMTERIELKKVCKLPQDAVEVFDEGLRSYFLRNDSATERGAAEHRVRIEEIDSSKGSAAAYIAKYISKHLDGKGLEVDLYGNPIESATPAVIAWSRVHSIRQFQQIGGPPVSVWRELRRLHPDNGAPENDQPEGLAAIADNLRAALSAVNLQLIEPGEKKAVAWKRYTDAQGGPTCRRKDWRVRLLRQDCEGVNRYGEPKAQRIVGVQAAGRVIVTAEVLGGFHALHGHSLTKRAVFEVESERADWIVVPKRATEDAFAEHCARIEAKIKAMDAQAAEAMRVQIERSRSEAAGGAAARPWTRVNNYTLTTSAPMFKPLHVRRQKLGRFYKWGEGGGQLPEKTEPWQQRN